MWDRPVQDDKANGAAKPVPRQPPARVLPPQPKKPANDYLGDIDLPSSSESESEDDGRPKKLYTPEDKDTHLHSMVRPSVRCPASGYANWLARITEAVMLIAAQRPFVVT